MITETKLPLKIACEALGIDRVSYYRNNVLLSNHHNVRDIYLKKMIEKILRVFSGYGYKRVTKQLQRQNQMINHKRVYRVMSENNLLYNRKKKFKITTTDSNHNLPVYKNLIKNLEITKLNQV